MAHDPHNPDPLKPYRAYYFQLEPTGVDPIDNILKEIAYAGKASHSTEGWGGQTWGEEDGPNHIERIQDAAVNAAIHILKLERNLEQKEERE